MLQTQASVDTSVMRSTIEVRHHIQRKLAISLANRQAAKVALTARFDHLKLHSSNLEATQTMVRNI